VAAAAPAAGLPAAATALLLFAGVALMAGAGAVTDFTRATAAQLADRSVYVDAVMANRGLVPSARGNGGS
jgi:hypothetical protein